MKKLFLILVISLLPVGGFAGNQAKTPAQKMMKLDIQYLTSKQIAASRLKISFEMPRADNDAALYIQRQFRKAGLESEIIPFEFLGGPYFSNVVAYRWSDKSPKAIVIGAHYDGVVYPAANDNASGTALVLALARKVAKREWKHNLIFIAFGAEERGLIGSKRFIENCVFTRGIDFMVNFDMVGRSSEPVVGMIYVAGDDENAAIREAFGGAAVSFAGDKPVFCGSPGALRDVEWLSDHTSFSKAAIPSVMVIGGCDNGNYHSPRDEEAIIDYEFMGKVLEKSFSALIILDEK